MQMNRPLRTDNPPTVGPIVSYADIGVTTLASENILVKTEWTCGLPES